MSVQRAKYEIASSDFIEWIVYLDEEPNRFHSEDYYLAQIASEVRRSIAKYPERVKVSDFLLKFGCKEKRVISKSDVRERTSKAKAFFNALVGRTKKPNKKEI